MRRIRVKKNPKIASFSHGNTQRFVLTDAKFFAVWRSGPSQPCRGPTPRPSPTHGRAQCVCCPHHAARVPNHEICFSFLTRQVHKLARRLSVSALQPLTAPPRTRTPVCSCSAADQPQRVAGARAWRKPASAMGGREGECDCATKAGGRDNCSCSVEGGCSSSEKAFDGGTRVPKLPFLVIKANLKRTADGAAMVQAFCNGMSSASSAQTGKKDRERRARLQKWNCRLAAMANASRFKNKLAEEHRVPRKNKKEFSELLCRELHVKLLKCVSLSTSASDALIGFGSGQHPLCSFTHLPVHQTLQLHTCMFTKRCNWVTSVAHRTTERRHALFFCTHAQGARQAAMAPYTQRLALGIVRRPAVTSPCPSPPRRSSSQMILCAPIGCT